MSRIGVNILIRDSEALRQEAAELRAEAARLRDDARALVREARRIQGRFNVLRTYAELARSSDRRRFVIVAPLQHGGSVLAPGDVVTDRHLGADTETLVARGLVVEGDYHLTDLNPPVDPKREEAEEEQEVEEELEELEDERGDTSGHA